MYDSFAMPRAVHGTSQAGIPEQAAISFPTSPGTSPELQVGSFTAEPPGKHMNPQFMNIDIHGNVWGF